MCIIFFLIRLRLSNERVLRYLCRGNGIEESSNMVLDRGEEKKYISLLIK